MNKIRIVYMFSLLTLFSVSANAATILVDGGQLTGATDVTVNGIAYDVLFENGTCETLYSGCDDNAITLISQADAEAAAQALLDQVFLGNFDTNPESTIFCTSQVSCLTRIIFRNGDTTTAAQSVVVNNAGSNTDSFFVETLTAANDSRIFSDVNFATFTVSSVPLPAGLVLMLSGLAALFGFARRRSLKV